MRDDVGVETNAYRLLWGGGPWATARPSLSDHASVLADLGSPEPIAIEPRRVVRISPFATAKRLLLPHGRT